VRRFDRVEIRLSALGRLSQDLRKQGIGLILVRGGRRSACVRVVVLGGDVCARFFIGRLIVVGVRKIERRLERVGRFDGEAGEFGPMAGARLNDEMVDVGLSEWILQTEQLRSTVHVKSTQPAIGADNSPAAASLA
jgi:hypothetical protein